MARLEMRIILRTILESLELQCLDAERPTFVWSGLFLAPKGGVRLRVV